MEIFVRTTDITPIKAVAKDLTIQIAFDKAVEIALAFAEAWFKFTVYIAITEDSFSTDNGGLSLFKNTDTTVLFFSQTFGKDAWVAKEDWISKGTCKVTLDVTFGSESETDLFS